MISDVNKYKKLISKFPRITREEENELAVKIKSGCNESYEKLYHSNLGLVVTIASSFANSKISIMDLISEGNIGLMKAVEKYESGNYKFSSYANFWIKQKIYTFIQNNRTLVKIPKDAYSLTQKIEKSTKLLHLELRRKPTAKEIAINLNTTEYTVKKNILYQFTEQSIYDVNQDDQTLEIVDNSPIQQGRNIIKSEITTEMRLAIRGIKKPIQQQIIKMLYGITPYKKAYSIKETAVELNYSVERVGQFKRITLRQLKTYCIERGLDKV